MLMNRDEDGDGDGDEALSETPSCSQLSLTHFPPFKDEGKLLN